MRRIVAAVLLLAASVVDTGAASAADPIYLDPSQPVPARVADMLRRMVARRVGRADDAGRAGRGQRGRHHQLPDRLAAVRWRFRASAQQRHLVGQHGTTASSARRPRPRSRFR
jgi:hypothetical protein